MAKIKSAKYKDECKDNALDSESDEEMPDIALIPNLIGGKSLLAHGYVYTKTKDAKSIDKIHWKCARAYGDSKQKQCFARVDTKLKSLKIISETGEHTHEKLSKKAYYLEVHRKKIYDRVEKIANENLHLKTAEVVKIVVEKFGHKSNLPIENIKKKIKRVRRLMNPKPKPSDENEYDKEDLANLKILEFPNLRGGKKLFVDGFTFVKMRGTLSPFKIYWWCDKKNGYDNFAPCPVTMHTSLDLKKVIFYKYKHTHPRTAEESVVEQNIADKELKTITKNNLTLETSEVLEIFLAKFGHLKTLPNIEKLKSKIRACKETMNKKIDQEEASIRKSYSSLKVIELPPRQRFRQITVDGFVYSTFGGINSTKNIQVWHCTNYDESEDYKKCPVRLQTKADSLEVLRIWRGKHTHPPPSIDKSVVEMRFAMNELKLMAEKGNSKEPSKMLSLFKAKFSHIKGMPSDNFLINKISRYYSKRENFTQSELDKLKEKMIVIPCVRGGMNIVVGGWIFKKRGGYKDKTYWICENYSGIPGKYKPCPAKITTIGDLFDLFEVKSNHTHRPPGDSMIQRHIALQKLKVMAENSSEDPVKMIKDFIKNHKHIKNMPYKGNLLASLRKAKRFGEEEKKESRFYKNRRKAYEIPTTKEQGFIKIFYKGFLYHKYHTGKEKDSSFWRCDKHNEKSGGIEICTAKIFTRTNSAEILYVRGNHPHEPENDKDVVEKYKLVHFLKKIMDKESEFEPSKICEILLSKYEDEFEQKPEQSKIMETIQRLITWYCEREDCIPNESQDINSNQDHLVERPMKRERSIEIMDIDDESMSEQSITEMMPLFSDFDDSEFESYDSFSSSDLNLRECFVKLDRIGEDFQFFDSFPLEKRLNECFVKLETLDPAIIEMSSQYLSPETSSSSNKISKLNRLNLTCDLCDFGTSKKTKMNLHMKYKHLRQQRMVKCSICGWKCAPRLLDFHRSIHHGDGERRAPPANKPHQCIFCAEKRMKFEDLVTHIDRCHFLAD